MTRHWAVIVLSLVLLAAAIVRLRLLEMPLERDEGEYGYAGQLILQGIPPYKLAYNMKLPGTYVAYAVIMSVFGETARGIHLGLLIVNSLTIVFVYLLGRRLFGQICAVVAAGVFAVLALSNSVLGLAAHATHFVTLFAVVGTLLLLKAVETRRPIILFGCGLTFGVAFLMKQPGIFFGLGAGVLLVWNEAQTGVFRRWAGSIGRLSCFSAGAILPFVVTCGLLAAAGVFPRFWFWTVIYAREYASSASLWSGWEAVRSTGSRILASAPGLWLLAALGICVSLKLSDRRALSFSLFFLIAGLLAVFPGFYFREHYFITVLPGIALFAGAGTQLIANRLMAKHGSRIGFGLPLFILLAAFAHATYHHRTLFFFLSPKDAVRDSYGLNPFPESVSIGRYIKEHSRPDSKVAVIGSEPEIYFYSGRRSATGYIYTYGLMESHEYASTMQREMIAEIEAAVPEFVVLVNVPTSWLARKDSSNQIFVWAQRYVHDEFRPVMLVDIQSLTRTVYHTNEGGASGAPRSKWFIWVLKRNNAP